jgi:hypothetical protein
MGALGWLFQAGFVGVLAAQEAADAIALRARRAFLGVTLACGLNAAIQAMVVQPRAFRLAELLMPGDSLRDFAFRLLPEYIPQKGTTIRLYARRPLAFYLSLQGAYRIELLPALGRRELERSTGSWVVIDGMMPDSTGLILSPTDYVSVDPITLLDHNPGAAFSKGGRLECDMYVIEESRLRRHGE